MNVMLTLIDLQKNPTVKMEDYIHESENLYTRITQKGMALTPTVVAFKLFDSFRIDARDRQLIFTSVIIHEIYHLIQ